MPFNAREASQRAAEKITSSASALVKQEAELICGILRPTALRHNTGPEAVVSRRIAARLKRVLPRIRKLEIRLNGPQVPAKQVLVRRELGKAVDSFFHEVAWDWIHLRLQMTDGPNAFQRMFRKLPRWFRGLVDQAQKRQGLPLGNVPGGLRPFSLKNVTGERRVPHFPGEVIQHHALPERQRKGLRPDGLEWIYSF